MAPIELKFCEAESRSDCNEVEAEEEYIQDIQQELCPSKLTHPLFPNNASIKQLANQLVIRTYEKPCNWYFLVFAPLNKPYLDHAFTIQECINKIGRTEGYIATRETQAKKIHFNIMAVSKTPLDTLNGKIYKHKYRIYSKKLDSLEFREHVLDYILKESKSRHFRRGIDYKFFIKI